MLRAAPASVPQMFIRARSPIRRMPVRSAPQPVAIGPMATITDSRRMLPEWEWSPKATVLMVSAPRNIVVPPIRPRTRQTRRRVNTVRATDSSLPEAAATATSRTPDVPRPASKRVLARTTMDSNTASSPTPAGPNSRATAFVLTIRMSIMTMLEPPMIDEDFSASMCEVSGSASVVMASSSRGGDVTAASSTGAPRHGRQPSGHQARDGTDRHEPMRPRPRRVPLEDGVSRPGHRSLLWTIWYEAVGQWREPTAQRPCDDHRRRCWPFPTLFAASRRGSVPPIRLRVAIVRSRPPLRYPPGDPSCGASANGPQDSWSPSGRPVHCGSTDRPGRLRRPYQSWRRPRRMTTRMHRAARRFRPHRPVVARLK